MPRRRIFSSATRGSQRAAAAAVTASAAATATTAVATATAPPPPTWASLTGSGRGGATPPRMCLLPRHVGRVGVPVGRRHRRGRLAPPLPRHPRRRARRCRCGGRRGVGGGAAAAARPHRRVRGVSTDGGTTDGVPGLCGRRSIFGAGAAGGGGCPAAGAAAAAAALPTAAGASASLSWSNAGKRTATQCCGGFSYYTTCCSSWCVPVGTYLQQQLITRRDCCVGPLTWPKVRSCLAIRRW